MWQLSVIITLDLFIYLYPYRIILLGGKFNYIFHTEHLLPNPLLLFAVCSTFSWSFLIWVEFMREQWLPSKCNLPLQVCLILSDCPMNLTLCQSCLFQQIFYLNLDTESKRNKRKIITKISKGIQFLCNNFLSLFGI